LSLSFCHCHFVIVILSSCHLVISSFYELVTNYLSNALLTKLIIDKMTI